MFTIVLAVLLGAAIITLGVLYNKYRSAVSANTRIFNQACVLNQEKTELQQRLDKRKERHLRASGHIQRQRALLEEKDTALLRANQIVELFLETFQGFEGDVTITRTQARRLFVAS